MTDARHYRIRTMRADEVSLAIDWAAGEGWNPGLNDAACFRAADPHGFLIGVLGDEPIATVSVVRYDAAFGFLGLYIVKPAYRGRGFGMQLWNAGLAYLGDRTIGLDGVVAQQDNYRRSGFDLAYRNVRYQGVATRQVVDERRIVPLTLLPFDTVNEYDRAIFGADRATFLHAWSEQPQAYAVGVMHHGELKGYGAIRAARSGHKIGPLFADEREYAESLYAALVASVPEGEAIYLDVPEPNAAAVALAADHGMSIVFETARMYRGAPPAVPVARVFGVTSFELG